MTNLRPMTSPRTFPRPFCVIAAALGALPLCGLLLLVPGEAAAEGPFAKWKDRKRNAPAAEASAPAPAKPKPFQGLFGPKAAPVPRAEPLVGSPTVPTAPPTAAPAAYRSETPSFSGSLPAAPRANPSQRRLFVLADSQGLLPFGEELQRALVAQGYEVVMHAVKNGTPYFWQGKWPSPVLTRLYEPAASLEQCGRWQEVSMTPRSIAAYVASYDPDVFVFQAGTNFDEDLAANHPGVASLMAESLREAAARGAKVLWIGPPDARDDVKSPEFQDRALDSLRAALAETSRAQGFDSLFDSRPVCPMPNDAPGDGEHPPNAAGREWGRSAAAWVGSAVSFWERKGALRPLGATAPSTPTAPAMASGDSIPAPAAAMAPAVPAAPVTAPVAAPIAAAPLLPPGYPVAAPTAYPPGYAAVPAPASPVSPAAGSPERAPENDFARRLREAPIDPASLVSLELELVAKSDPGEVRSLDYSDAFAVYRYRVRDAVLSGARLAAFGVKPDAASGEYFVQVLHWAVHNDGSGPRATRTAQRAVGDLSFATLCPLDKHPLAGPLSTMARFDEINDFEAPVFVAADLVEERRF
jgi:hypothetical protein